MYLLMFVLSAACTFVRPLRTPSSTLRRVARILLLLVRVADAPPKGVLVVSTDTSRKSLILSCIQRKRSRANSRRIVEHDQIELTVAPDFSGAVRLVHVRYTALGSHALLLFTAAFAVTEALRCIAWTPCFKTPVVPI